MPPSDHRRLGSAVAAEADDGLRVMPSLVPILWSTGVGADVMKPIAAPIIGAMITSTIHVLINIPIVFYMLKVKRGRQISAPTA
jgi:Cu/Ag efflux pump CusA